MFHLLFVYTFLAERGVIKVFILTDGKRYVMENPMQQGKYISSTSPCHAKEFTWKQAKNLLNNNRKSLSWIKNGYYVMDKDTGKVEKANKVRFGSNGGSFVGNKSYEFNFDIVKNIDKEVDMILKLDTWDVEDLNKTKSELQQGLQFYDSAISDVYHARMDKRPPAHIRTKVDGLLNELEETRRDIKQSLNYIDILIDAVNNHWNMSKIKTELEKAKYVPYKGRTKYYDEALNLLSNY